MEIKSFTVGQVETKAYLVKDAATNTAFMIDPGDDAERLLKAAEGAEVQYVILTHAHFDHVMAVREILESTGARLAVHSCEVPALTDAELAGFTSFGLDGMTPLSADIVLEDGDRLPFGDTELEILHTPGHTPGSICIRMGDVLFTGDTLFAGTCGRCDLPGGDYGDMLASLRRLSMLEGDARVYPGHNEPTTLDIERKFNPYMREAIRG